MIINLKNNELEDKYRITISVDEVHLLVENVSVPNSCAINIFKFQDNEDGTIKKAFDEKNWNQFICELIDTGYLD
jgi:hypothetical protein